MNSVKLREKLAIGFVAVDVWGGGDGGRLSVRIVYEMSERHRNQLQRYK